MDPLRRLLRCNRGVTMVEYAILLLLIAVVSIGVIATLGSNARNAFSSVACQGLHGEAARDCSGKSPGKSGNH
jgi:Flp pilus assembly pilin Flp